MMYLSSMIKDLQALAAEHGGDLEMYAMGPEGDMLPISLAEFNDDDGRCVLINFDND